MDTSRLMLAVAVTLIASAVAVGLARKLRLGSILALLLVGVALGPHAPLPLFTNHIDEMQAVGEIGVMLLLFAVGLDIQPRRLASMGRLVLGLGFAQYAVTTAAILAFFMVMAAAPVWQSALVVSLGLAMSSMAIPLPILRARGDEATGHGRAVLAIDIFQTLMVVPVLALIPVLGAGNVASASPRGLPMLLEVVAAIGGVYAIGRYVLPRALAITARSFGPGGFIVIVLAGVFFSGWWMQTAGLSMALGAFMIGVLLSTSVYVEQVKAAVTPSRQLLLALFFIAIGMALDPRQLFELRGELLLYLPAILLIKIAVLFVVAMLFRLDVRSAVLTAFLMMPFDEICFVVLANAKANGLLVDRYYTVGLAMISFSFVVSPLLIDVAYRVTARLAGSGAAPGGTTRPPSVHGQVVVAGCGYVGRAICAMLERAGIAYTAFEQDPESLRKAKEAGHRVLYADLTDPMVLSTAGVVRASLMVVTMRLYEPTRQLIGNLQRFYPQVPVMIAVTYLAQRDQLRQMGAKDVVALAPEGTLSFGRSLLERLGRSADEAAAISDMLRSKDYAALRAAAKVTDDTGATRRATVLTPAQPTLHSIEAIRSDVNGGAI